MDRPFEDWFPTDQVFFYCPKCMGHHWITQQLVDMPSSTARLAKIEQLWASEDISLKDYNYWKHVVIAYAVHLAVKGTPLQRPDPVGYRRVWDDYDD